MRANNQNPTCRHRDPELWKDVAGYDGVYQVSTEGRVRKKYSDGRIRMIKPRTFGKHPMIGVRVEDKYGKLHNLSLHRLVAEAFIGPLGDKVAVHKNGLYSDNSFRNLAIMSKTEFAKLRNKRAFRQPVKKIAPDGSVVDVFPSARDAAKSDFVNIHAVTDRCNRMLQDEFSFTGFSYRWDK
jgi:hypothetical protein